MGKIKGFNKYEIRKEITVIFLTDNSNSIIAEAIIDTEDLQKLIDLNLCFHASLKQKNTKNYYCEAIQYKKLLNGNRAKKTIYLHRIILDVADRKTRVDHIDHNPLNNKKCNLRKSNASTNSTHRNKLNSNNKTGYRNICQYKNKLIVQMQVNGKNKILRSFELDELDEAILYTELKRKELYGDFAGENGK